MAYSNRIIIQAVFIAGIVLLGCGPNHKNIPGSAENVNQVDNSGIKQGPWKIYSDTVLTAEGSYINGKRDGLWRFWYQNGQMKEEGHYKMGIKNGIWVEWYQDGDIMWKGEWENGTRHIEDMGAQAEISFVGKGPADHVLAARGLYKLKIRIQNIPAGNIFVEVSSGEIARDGDTGLYILKTSSDTLLTIVVGYMPDLEYKDFRNLVSEIDFKLE